MSSITQVDDSIIDRRIGILLRVGMLVSAAVIALGGALFLSHHGLTPVDFRSFHGQPQDLTSPVRILAGAFHGSDIEIIQFGLLLLIATPVARVMFSVFEFAMERDYLYVVIASAVLVVLLYSLVLHGK